MKLDLLRLGRATAALMVAAFHANAFILPERIYGGTRAWQALEMGDAGVEFFFVLTGFLMVYVHGQDIGRPERAPLFLWKRIRRIFSIYWIVLAALVAAYAALPEFGPPHARDPVAILTSFLVIPAAGPPITSIAWTLEHAMLFHLVFLAAIAAPRVGLGLMAAWMAVSAVALGVPGATRPWSTLASPFNLLFGLGMIAAAVFRRLPDQASAPAALVGIAMIFSVGLSETYGLVSWDIGLRTLGYGIGAALAVAGLAALSVRGIVRPPRLAVFLGDASYSIYLIHLPCMSLAALALRATGLGAEVPPLAMCAALVVLSAAAAVLLFVLIERPLLSALSAPARRAETAGASDTASDHRRAGGPEA